MNRRSAGNSASRPSIVCSSRSTSAVVTAAFVTRPAIRDDGSARRAPSANRSFWMDSSGPRDVRVHASRPCGAKTGIQLVDLAVGVYSRVRLRHARVVEQRGLDLRRRSWYRSSPVEEPRVPRRVQSRGTREIIGAMSASSLPPAASRRRFRRALLAWYAVHGRDLPWRRTADPYHILVSEIMLQQTQVDRVVPKYHEWLEKYPSLEALATASEVGRFEHMASAWL